MDSFEDILNRVFKSSADRAVNRVNTAAPAQRRPLRDPYNDTVSFFTDISSAVRNIRSPEVASALQARATLPVEEQGIRPQDSSDDSGGFGDVPTVPQPRQTNLNDDLRAFSDLSNVAVSMVKQVALAGRAIADFAGDTGKLDRAVGGMAESAEGATKALKPLEGFKEWIGSFFGGRTAEKRDDQSAKSNPASEAPSSPAEKSEQSTDPISKFLNSSSIADGIRGLVSQIKIPGVSQAPGDASNPQQSQQASGFTQQMNSTFDSMLARAMHMFQAMSRRGREPQTEEQARSSGGFGQFRDVIANRVGRAGRRILAKNFRGRVQNGKQVIRQQMSRRAASQTFTPGGSGFSGSGGRVLNFFGRMFGGAAAGGGGGAGGGAVGAGAVGGGGGGAGAAGGAAAGGAAAAGGLAVGAVVTGGLLLAVVALIAAAVTATKALYSLGMQGYETSLRVAQWNGALSAAKSQLDVHRLMRDVQSAQTLSSSGSRLIQTFDRLEEALRPITDGALVIGMEFLVVTVNLLIDTFMALAESVLMTAKLMAIVTPDPLDNMIVAALEKKFNEIKNPPNPANVAQRGFFDEFENRPIQRPRGPLPPLNGPAAGGKVGP